VIAARVLTAAAAGTRPRHARQRLDPGLDAQALAEERRPQVIDLLAPDDEDAPRPSVGGEVPAYVLRPISTGLRDPAAQRRLGQVKVTRHLGDRLALIEHQSDGTRLELVREAPTGSLHLLRLLHLGHHIDLSVDVQKTGSSPPANESLMWR